MLGTGRLGCEDARCGARLLALSAVGRGDAVAAAQDGAACVGRDAERWVVACKPRHRAAGGVHPTVVTPAYGRSLDG